VHVRVVADLAKHEIGNVGTRDPRNDRRGPNVDAVPVKACSRAACQSRRTHDDPVQSASLDDPLLGLVIGDDVTQQQRGDDSSSDEAQLTSSLPNAEKGQVNEAPRPVPPHRVDDVSNASDQAVVAT
jgi:hypothetical protein